MTVVLNNLRTTRGNSTTRGLKSYRNLFHLIIRKRKTVPLLSSNNGFERKNDFGMYTRCSTSRRNKKDIFGELCTQYIWKFFVLHILRESYGPKKVLRVCNLMLGYMFQTTLHKLCNDIRDSGCFFAKRT